MKSWNLLEPILACPFTHQPLMLSSDKSAMTSPSGYSFPLIRGVPMLRPGPAPEIKDINHVSNMVGAEMRQMMLDCPGRVLFLGAGASDFRADHVFELEYNLFRDTDVLGDGHCLPFKDNAFDLAVALNVFEHLREPHLAAAEMFRVLAPGGKVFIHTAFVQPLHEAPHHYYNATEFGVRQWFNIFDQVDVTISPNFQPFHGLSWIFSDLLDCVQIMLGDEQRKRLEQVSLGELASGWRNANYSQSTTWQILSQLPPSVVTRFASGFQLQAVKPVGN